MATQTETVEMKEQSKGTQSVTIRFPIELIEKYKIHAKLEGKQVSEFIRDKVLFAESILEGKLEEEASNDDIMDLLKTVSLEQEAMKELFYARNVDTGEQVPCFIGLNNRLISIQKELKGVNGEVIEVKTAIDGVQSMVNKTKTEIVIVKTNVNEVERAVRDLTSENGSNLRNTLLDIETGVHRLRDKVDKELSKNIADLIGWSWILMLLGTGLLFGFIGGCFCMYSYNELKNQRPIDNTGLGTSFKASESQVKAEDISGKSGNQKPSKKPQGKSKSGSRGEK